MFQFPSSEYFAYYMAAFAPQRMYIDFDGFFASAEQHVNPSLRGKPVGVVPLDSPNTGCIALSREAKARGLRGMASIKDARKLIPDIIFVVARHDVYVRLHHRILRVVESCLPIAHVRSIDEVVCTLLASEGTHALALAQEVKSRLEQEFSPTLTCSIGMASTELLAKIAAEMDKPNGMIVLDDNHLPRRLADMDLRDIPGISNGIEARLERAGVTRFEALWRLSPKHARAIWSSVEGERFCHELHGSHAERPATKKRMFGHSRILPFEWRNAEKAEICARMLTMSAARRLRRTDLLARSLSLGFRGGGKRSPGFNKKDRMRWNWETNLTPARDDWSFLAALACGFEEAKQTMSFQPKSVSVMLHGLLKPNEITGDLFSTKNQENLFGRFDTVSKWETLSDLMDQMRNDHGPAAISLGPPIKMPGGYLGSKIAFGRIPDMSDFSDQATQDSATQYCSF